ncbi:MAG: DnaD domain protein [Faecalimonas sp.]|nr:DnaD domain protein [Faecalimonas sp.]
MSALILRNRFQRDTTTVGNDFIDNYMAKANGEYVKVYLLLLRLLNTEDTTLRVSTLADCLDCTEKDIQRAFRYWSKVGLLKIEYNEEGNICGLSMGADVNSSTETAQPAAALEHAAPAKEPASSSPTNRDAKSRAELKQLYFVIAQYIGKTLSSNDYEKINYFYDSLGFSSDLIEYLVESCVDSGHKSMRYIEAVALAWADAKIATVEDAKLRSSLYSKNCFAVLKAFGISGRNPAAVETNYIRKWTDEYGFSLDIILEACNRTIANTAKADFKYTDSILKNWFAKDVHHLADISRLDSAHQQERTSQKRVAAKPAASAKRFNNFEGRSYDIHSLEQQLLNTGN